jgi:endonuclease YncB( thermonuclease family)
VRSWRILATFLGALALAACGSSTVSSGPPAHGSASASGTAAVERVVDGDTIIVTGHIRVRLIGMDTPEVVDPRKPVQCFGEAASARTKALLPRGTAVRLVYDADRYDRYGRTLAYVYRARRFVRQRRARPRRVRACSHGAAERRARERIPAAGTRRAPRGTRLMVGVQ